MALAALVALAALLGTAIDFLPPLHMAVGYNWLLRSFHPVAYTESGLYWLMPWNTFRLVPSTIQTIPLGSESGSQPVWGRTSNGLTVVLTMSVQYRYEAASLAELFAAVQTDAPDPEAPGDLARTYHPGQNILHGYALSALCNAASTFAPHEFFWERGVVTDALADAARKALAPYVRVTSVQLLRIDIPQAFETALMESSVARLQIRLAERIKETRRVQFRTLRLAARYAQIVTVTIARGRAAIARQRGLLHAAQTMQTVRAEMEAFANVTERLGGGSGAGGGGGGGWSLPGAARERVTPHQVLDYAFWQLVIGDTPGGKAGRLPLHDLLLKPPMGRGGSMGGTSAGGRRAAEASGGAPPTKVRSRWEERAERRRRASRSRQAAGPAQA